MGGRGAAVQRADPSAPGMSGESRPLRIGVLLRHIEEKGGIAVYTKNLLETLFRIDETNSYLLLYSRPSQRGRIALGPRVTEHLLTFPTKLLWDQIRVPVFAARRSIDLIFQPKLSIPMLGRFARVFTLHGAEQFEAPEAFAAGDRLYTRLAMPLYCRRADAVLLGTETAARSAAAHLGVDPSRFVAIPLAAHSRFRPVGREEALAVAARYGVAPPYLLFVGGLAPLKNFGNLLRAFASIAKGRPHLLLAPGFLRRAWSADLALLEELGLAGRVRFPGFVPDEDLPALYSLADLLVLPSLSEGFGIPIVEAMACGCPVVATRAGGCPEVAGDAAVLVDPRDPAAIAGGILRVLEDPALREDLIARGLQRASQFCYERTARETLALFERIAAARSGR
ncbi:MAG: glycosyltransferase family 1 protein [Candidatus Eisenbacteria bacterium]|nr:glycosyltransferase family 1 protein [Candidatus Eisenbacteria bacterium]